MRQLALSFFFLFLSTAALAAPHFPALTDRVVDDAHVLSQRTITILDERLAVQEEKTGNQLVVVTVPSLEGMPIEDYGYQLGRFWGIGQKGKNNGTLLLIAPKEHKLRIEVGYGLEGTVTDAIASEIINGIIVPDIRAGDMERGIVEGTQALLNAMNGKPITAATDDSDIHEQAVNQNMPPSAFQTFLTFLFLGLFLIFVIRHPFLAYMLLSSTSRYGGSSSGGGGWGGGGGGSFGGGGASGSW